MTDDKADQMIVILNAIHAELLNQSDMLLRIRELLRK
jgi:hypothetical protein